ncbi:MAG: peptidylprolyl isomerase, partial [Prevotella sp.]|nr:peptidylprolyl isomerase [Prevotella sp.]
MKKIVIALISLFVWTGTAMAQPKAADPVIMTVNGVPVTRSEFEYSYNKNNSEGVIDKKTVDEYVDLFINYKLKVAAALDAKLDTLTSFKEEFAMYRDQQVKPSFVENADLMAEARKVYDDTKANIGPQGLIMPAHILLRLAQKAPKAEQDKAQLRIDSIYRALQQGADFAELAKKLSQDPGSAARGGVLPWLGPGQTLPEFEKEAYALQPGQMSKPFLSPAGYHIILMKERKQLEPFDSLKTDILRFLEQRGVRERIADENINKVAAASNGKLTRQQVLENRADELSEKDPELKNLIREYHDGLLLYEISTREVWDKAAKDEAGQEAYFKAHRKKYNWDEPRFKGMAYHVKDQADV